MSGDEILIDTAITDAEVIADLKALLSGAESELADARAEVAQLRQDVEREQRMTAAAIEDYDTARAALEVAEGALRKTTRCQTCAPQSLAALAQVCEALGGA